jgi:hypothetical protein
VLRSSLLLLEDIQKSCERVVYYADGLTRDQVFVDEMRFDAVLFNLHVIGEAVKKLPSALREKHSDIAWRESQACAISLPTPTLPSTWTFSGMPSGRMFRPCSRAYVR